MVQRPDIVAVEASASLEVLKQKFIETGFSKILVYEGSIDNIIGYVSSKELFKNPINIKSRIIKAPIVPETMNANKLLHVLLQERKSLAVVVDEFGGTSGIVSTEDIMEEIFGEIEDEHDTNETVEKVLSNNSYIFSGKMEIDTLNSKYNLQIPENDDYDTLAGFVIFNLGRIPALNETFEISGFEIKLLKTNNKRLELIFIKKLDE
jgi:CBS domain containing-hemolysin-like protein